ncbi:hypothetical protein BH10PLA1_BH10PLA1_16380 [soil metagenome]
MTDQTGKKIVKSKAVQVDMTSPWQKYANVVLIPVIIGMSVFLLVRFRMNAAANAVSQEKADLTSVRMMLRDFRSADPSRSSGNQDQLAMFRDSRYLDASRKIEELLASAKDPYIRAEALIAQGDLNWLIANFPQLPGATTRPSLKAPKSNDEYLAAAEKAYKSVVNDYVDQRMSAISARLGLGAIAENRRDWTDANKDYQIVADDKSAPAAFSTLAQQRLEIIKVIKEPVLLGQAHAPTTQDVESMLPTTMPMLPTTFPAAMQNVLPLPPTTKSASTQPSK